MEGVPEDPSKPLLIRNGSDLGNANGRAVEAARGVVEALTASIGSADIDRHAALFAAFELLANEIDLDALARNRPSLVPSRQRRGLRRILVIRLSALGDFVQALGPAAAIRRYHSGDHVTLLTTAAFADFAQRLGVFDHVMIDARPGPYDIRGWLELRRRLRRSCFDRVYDLQTSERSAAYARLFRRGPTPEWSGIAAGCSHPHANLDRDRQHTIDKQAEQLLMAGIHPTPLPVLPALACEFPQSALGRRFVLIVPGSSPRHPAKRWPARRYGMLAEALRESGYGSVIIGSAAERALAAAIQQACAEAIDLTGQTDFAAVATLAQRAVLTIGNDTGVMHLAAAADCPVVVLFSAVTDPALCGPRGRLVRVLAVRNLDALEVDRVLDEVLSTIAQRAHAARSRPAAGTAIARRVPG
ncbi:MAG: glycosyltransferase family 9 protein [Alphaproteobacteria bacterium]|nr:glycosyltransferase family 9 protein [Alphaproteobacteria bacterium]